MRREQNPQTRDWTFTIGHKELVVHQRYEVLSILNDFLLGLAAETECNTLKF